ncbi:MAG: LysE family translocator [Anaerolineae bacterium]|nr:LysE family translocator [Anaerolineae bacterium]
MPTLPTIGVFVAAAFGLLIIPGPAVLYIVARSIDQGRRAGLVSALGVDVANLLHVIAATLGLSTLLMASALAFTVVKYAGAAYLIYLGVRTLLARGQAQANAVDRRQKLSRIFSQGVLVNLLNPKTALFFFAFLPQFVDPARGPAAVQFLFFGVLFVIMAICSDCTYAILAGTLGGRLKESTAFLRVQRYFAGSIYVALGVMTALTGSGKSQ